VVRIESHGYGLRITVTLNPDIARRPTVKSRHFTEVGEAVRAIEAFLRRFADEWSR